MSESVKKIDPEDADVEIEIVDDTPENDRGRPLAPEQTDNDDDITVQETEVSRYKDDVQKRIKDLSFKANSERRAKEAAVNERNQAIQYAQQIIAENQRLKQFSAHSENSLVANAKARTTTQIEFIKRAAKEAFEAGETEKFMNLQEQLQRVVSEDEKYSSYTPHTIQQEQPVQQQPQQRNQEQRQQIPEPDSLAKEWYSNNQWFQADGDLESEMTAYAFGVSDILMKQKGVDPSSPEYYEGIDKAVRKRFSEYAGFKKSDAAPNATGQMTTVVAPAGRSQKTARTVRLTATQVRLARRLGLTLEQYAASL